MFWIFLFIAIFGLAESKNAVEQNNPVSKFLGLLFSIIGILGMSYYAGLWSF